MIDKNGQGNLFLIIIYVIFIIAAGFLMLNFLPTEIDNVRAVANLDCSNADISDGAKLMCLVTDSVIPVYILGVIGLIVLIIITRKVFS